MMQKFQATSGAHLTTPEMADADGSQANAATSGVYENLVTATNTTTHDQCIICCAIHHWHCGCLLQAPGIRHIKDLQVNITQLTSTADTSAMLGMTTTLNLAASCQ